MVGSVTQPLISQAMPVTRAKIPSIVTLIAAMPSSCRPQSRNVIPVRIANMSYLRYAWQYTAKRKPPTVKSGAAFLF